MVAKRMACHADDVDEQGYLPVDLTCVDWQAIVDFLTLSARERMEWESGK